MMRCLIDIIDSSMVEERHYFLEELNTPAVLWGIRAVCILAALTVFIVYVVSRKKAAADDSRKSEQEE